MFLVWAAPEGIKPLPYGSFGQVQTWNYIVVAHWLTHCSKPWILSVINLLNKQRLLYFHRNPLFRVSFPILFNIVCAWTLHFVCCCS